MIDSSLLESPLTDAWVISELPCSVKMLIVSVQIVFQLTDFKELA